MSIETKEVLFEQQQGRDYVRVTLDSVNGSAKVGIRLWYDDENNVRRPGKGVSLTLQNAKAILNATFTKQLPKE